MEPLTEQEKEILRKQLIRQKAILNKKRKRRIKQRLQKASRKINRRK